MNQIEISEAVMFYDTDCGGVVSNIAYLRFVEKARSALFESLGMTPSEMNESQLFPAVVRTEIDYLFPARLGDKITVSATLVGVEKVRATCSFQLSRAESNGDPKAIAKASQQVVMVQMPSGRPRRIPEKWLDQVK